MKRFNASAVIGLLTGLALHCTAVGAELFEYRAEYKAEYKGRNVGTSVFLLERNAEAGDYVFSSAMQAKGLLRLASPRPIVDRSEFAVTAEEIVPHRFAHEDGSRKGEDNFTIEFDWDAGSAGISGDGYSRDMPLSQGALDRGSLQVALMQTLAAGQQPATFTVLDEDGVDEYAYEFEGRQTIETEIGNIEVLRYRQQRAGSSRYTIIDLAPSLNFVPARIEQIRDGESQSAFLIESLEPL